MTATDPMTHLGLILPNYGSALEPRALIRATRAAEDAGFDSGWLTDHVLVPRDIGPIYGTIAEALVTLGFLLGSTERIRIGVSALIVPLREPILTLKQLITADYLSGGRVLTAVAAGWLEGEFETLGAPYDDRGRRLDSWMDLAIESFAVSPGMLKPAWVTTDGGWMAPGPISPAGPELWVAGVSRATLRRAAKTGVWHPVALTVDELETMAAGFRKLRPDGRVMLRIGIYNSEVPDPEATDERGRPAIGGPPEWIAEHLRRYLDAGCDGFVLNLDHQRPDLETRVERFRRDVLPLLERAEA